MAYVVHVGSKPIPFIFAAIVVGLIVPSGWKIPVT